VTPGTGKFFPANNYHMHLFNGSYECMGDEDKKEPMTSNIVNLLRNECQCSDDCRAVNDPCIPMRAADEIEQIGEQLKDCNNDFDCLRLMHDKMRADRDLWKEVAENLATELGKKEYADAEYETCKQVAQGVAW